MRLKQIKLAGFKSFVDATTVPFPDQMTAIVGPNGCGKSNVIDAVRWVLGESSAKNLRGDAMTDVIFNGSTNRKPVSQASVELMFDNAQGRVQGSLADRNQISVKRQVSKEGQSTYFLNGTKCRRRDITDIFLGTGLGPRSYAIIEQGMISRLIESKPQELRVFLEEAAGISKYKERRRETENRIRHTRDNLERLQDVREELGAQLDKLKRQAATARRFKELKGKERKFKAELYALKWHKYNEQLNRFEQERLAKETQLEAFITQQRGGELGMLQLKQQHQSLMDKAQEAQQSLFQAGNVITKLEQQIVFSQQKQKQQQEQKQQLEVNITDVNEQIAAATDKLAQQQAQLAVMEPDAELLDEQLYHASESLLMAEQDYEDWQSSWQQQQKMAARSQQSAQVIETKIQAQHTLLARLKQRQLELEKELSEIAQTNLQQTLIAAEQALADNNNLLSECKHTCAKLDDKAQLDQQHLTQAEQKLLRVSKQADESRIHLTNLQTWLEQYQAGNGDDTQQQLAEQGISSFGNLLTQLTVEDDWQQAIETLLSHHGQAQVVDKLPQQALSGQWLTAYQGQAVAGSAASKIIKGAYPYWLNRVALLETDTSQLNSNPSLLAEQLTSLLQGEFICVLDQQGNWYGQNWQGSGSIDRSGDTQVLAKMQQLESLSDDVIAAEQARQQATEQVQHSQQQQLQSKQALSSQQQQLAKLQQQHIELQMQVKLQQQQAQQNAKLRLKLDNDLADLVEHIELEQATVINLEQELALGQEQNLAVTEQLSQLEQDKQQRQQQLNSAKAQVDRLKSDNHQLALKLQSVKSEISVSRDTLTRGKQHLAQLQQQLAQTQDTLSAKQNPDFELNQTLQQALQDKLEREQNLAQLQNEQSEAAEKIAQLEQGQSGIIAKLDSMRSDIASVKLDSEGARVRAQNMLDTLKEMDQQLKPVLEAMPVEADETKWSEELEQASQAIARLGAINLAAIEEYDVQAQRKAYLDTQYQDLIDALDTLESAIKKIDRESKAKFKDTFDKVNDGLQSLFPKVFGGGSAYLALTGDDLLDTGVTIMARPPGKKNSTIHLLSGGEKALTALSLVFSIFRLNPAPFCMLDEVDAPLDDANVGRFCKLVQEMSESVQFIYISHNKVAMEMATHLTGVTMQEPGVSRLVAVDIQQAVKMAQA